MTLIVAIKCNNGVVVGADGVATFSTMMGENTILQPIKKIKILNGSIILAAAGAVGLGQRFAGVIGTHATEGSLVLGTSWETMINVRHMLWEQIVFELQAAQGMQSLIGSIAIDSALSASVLAVVVDGAPCLFQFDKQAAPVEATIDLPFVAIGSGQSLADPFLAFIRRVLWMNEMPTLQQGIFATMWTLEHAIKTNTGGVADPKQVVILRQVDGVWQASELTDDDHQEALEAISQVEDAVRNVFDQGVEVPGNLPPAPPNEQVQAML